MRRRCGAWARGRPGVVRDRHGFGGAAGRGSRRSGGRGDEPRLARAAARRALVRRELSPAGEHAAARAAQGGLRTGAGKPPLARLRRIAALEARAALHSGPAAGMPRPARPAGQGQAAPSGSLHHSGLPIPIAMTGPGGADLASDCLVTCNTDSMVVPGEPVTLSGEIWNDSTDPPVSEQVQVQFQQFCPATDTDQTAATTTVTDPRFSALRPRGPRYPRVSKSSRKLRQRTAGRLPELRGGRLGDRRWRDGRRGSHNALRRERPVGSASGVCVLAGLVRRDGGAGFPG